MESIETKEKKFYYNSLFYDYIFSYEKLKSYFHYDFHDTENFKKRADHISSNYNNGFRAVLSDRLCHINKNLGCSEATIKNCESLKDPHTMVVIGGQQPGLLTGPAFIVYKIFSIIKLAVFLSDYLNLKVIPVFWNASDDSNFSQVNNTFLLDKEPKKVVLSSDEITGFTDDRFSKRFSDIIIEEGLAAKKIGELMGFLPDTDFKAGIGDFFGDCLDRLSKGQSDRTNYEGSICSKPVPMPDSNTAISSGPENNFGLNDFFSAIITGLFSKYGLVIIDPSDTELKKLSLPLLEKDICSHGRIEELINRSGEKLVNEGYHSQLAAGKDFLNFFIIKEGVRKRIKYSGNSSYAIDNRTLSEGDLKSLIFSDYSKISLNVVLRPLFQDTILPVLATVCGPGEVSYFSQLKEVYDVFGLKQPVIYPRSSVTIVEDKVKKAIEKAGVSSELFNHEMKDALSITLKKSLGIDVETILKSLQEDILIKTGCARDIIDNNGIICEACFGRLEYNLKREIEILNKKIMSEIENKNLSLASNIVKIYANLFPEGLLQERVINIFHYINKYDFKLLDDLYSIINVENRFHKFIFL